MLNKYSEKRHIKGAGREYIDTAGVRLVFDDGKYAGWYDPNGTGMYSVTRDKNGYRVSVNIPFDFKVCVDVANDANTIEDQNNMIQMYAKTIKGKGYEHVKLILGSHEIHLVFDDGKYSGWYCANDCGAFFDIRNSEKDYYAVYYMDEFVIEVVIIIV